MKERWDEMRHRDEWRGESECQNCNEGVVGWDETQGWVTRRKWVSKQWSQKRRPLVCENKLVPTQHSSSTHKCQQMLQVSKHSQQIQSQQWKCFSDPPLKRIHVAPCAATQCKQWASYYSYLSKHFISDHWFGTSNNKYFDDTNATFVTQALVQRN